VEELGFDGGIIADWKTNWDFKSDRLDVCAAEALMVYRRRKAIAWAPNGWLKAVLGYRQFSMRGIENRVCRVQARLHGPEFTADGLFMSRGRGSVELCGHARLEEKPRNGNSTQVCADRTIRPARSSAERSATGTIIVRYTTQNAPPETQ
jgi:hypothetical protein